MLVSMIAYVVCVLHSNGGGGKGLDMGCIVGERTPGQVRALVIELWTVQYSKRKRVIQVH